MAEVAHRAADPSHGPPTGRAVPPGSDTAAPVRPPGRRRPWFGLGALLVVLAAALVVGSGVGQGGHRTPAQRAAALDAELRCPSCEDLSVAQSSASSAVAVRHEVLRLARQGRSDQQIEDALVGQYGTTILLRPPTSGLASLVWIVPGLAGIAAAAALGVLFWRRGRQMAELRRGPE
jgi:cytochrome c-type biogenesis protein CcmH